MKKVSKKVSLNLSLSQSVASSQKLDEHLNKSYTGKIKISRAGSIKADEDGESSDLSESLCSEDGAAEYTRSLSTRVQRLLQAHHNKDKGVKIKAKRHFLCCFKKY